MINSVDLPASLTKLEETLLEANSALETKHLAEVEARKQLEERVVALETFIASTSTTATTSTVTATSTTVTTGTATTTTVPYVPVACHGVAESPGCGTRIPVADCDEGGEHESFARANCPSMCGLACTSTSTTVSSTTTVTTTSVTTTTVNEDGTLQGTGNNCKEIKDANRNAKSGKYELNVLGNLQVYCDMDTDGGGWTLVMRSNNEKDITEEDASAHGDVAALQDLKGASAKYSDAFINKLKSGSSERIGYRSTSFRIDSKYFHPGSCKYHHGSLDNNFNDKAGRTRETFLPRFCSRILMDCVAPLSRGGRRNPSVPSRCGSPLLLLTCSLLMTSTHFEGRSSPPSSWTLP